MSKESPLGTLVGDLRKRLPLHADIGRLLVQNHEMQFPCDYLAIGTIKRSMCLIEGFCSLIGNNFVCASPLVPLQLDNALRMGAVLLVSDLNDFGLRIFKGEKISKLKDRHGRLMNDGYLVDQLEKVEPGVRAIYDHLCGYVHLSNLHIINAMSLCGERQGEIHLSGKDEFITDDNRRDALVTMRSATDLVLETVDKYMTLPVPPMLP